MGHGDRQSSGIVCTVSRRAGVVAGTSVVISRKIADCGAKTVAAAKNCLKQPLKCLVPARVGKSGTTPQVSVLELEDEQETGRKKAAKALIAAMETHSKLTSQLGGLKAEKKSLLSDILFLIGHTGTDNRGVCVALIQDFAIRAAAKK